MLADLLEIVNLDKIFSDTAPSIKKTILETLNHMRKNIKTITVTRDGTISLTIETADLMKTEDELTDTITRLCRKHRLTYRYTVNPPYIRTIEISKETDLYEEPAEIYRAQINMWLLSGQGTLKNLAIIPIITIKKLKTTEQEDALHT